MDPTPMLLMLLDLWETQGERCDYCRIVLESKGLAQISIDRIDNANREYGKHNVHLTCWECNRGKGSATHEEMVELWDKRKAVWSPPTATPEASQERAKVTENAAKVASGEENAIAKGISSRQQR
jgi:hypothetical protein